MDPSFLHYTRENQGKFSDERQVFHDTLYEFSFYSDQHGAVMAEENPDAPTFTVKGDLLKNKATPSILALIAIAISRTGIYDTWLQF